jgi:hypothetical protein
MEEAFAGGPLEKLQKELKELDKELVQVDGGHLKPSQCYRFETDPVHMMYNTNCPDSLKQKIEAILSRHLPTYESGPQE